ncbi:hypothetical protein BO71DRAFT_403346, partial [Aspergillus ellipticus CBS 707.79]
VHVGTPIDQCVANNEARLNRASNPQSSTESSTDTPQPNPESTTESSPETTTTTTTDTEDPYPPELLNNLIFRYEEPSIHSRWDKPLFTVPWSDASPPIAEIWTALTGIPHPTTLNLAPTPADEPTPISKLVSSLSRTELNPSSVASTTTSAAGSSLRTRPKIKPHQATTLPAATDSSALYNMEKCTSAIVSAIRTFTLEHPSAEAALAQSQNARSIAIPVPDASLPVFLPAHVATAGTTDELAAAGGILALPRLQRLRRQWIALNRAYIMGTHASSKGGLTPEQVPDAFVRFLNAEFGAEDEQ